MQTEEIHLLNRVLLGEAAAAEQFVRQYTRFVHMVIREYRLPPHECDDIFQRVFVRLWANQMRALREWKGTGSFLTYLRPIVRNIVLDELRGRTFDVPPEEIPLDDDGGSREAIREIVKEALGKLSPRERELIRLKHFEGWSYREIAERLDMTVTNVGVALCRAEARLRLLLKGHV